MECHEQNHQNMQIQENTSEWKIKQVLYMRGDF